MNAILETFTYIHVLLCESNHEIGYWDEIGVNDCEGIKYNHSHNILFIYIRFDKM